MILPHPFCFPGMEEPRAEGYFASIQTIFNEQIAPSNHHNRFRC
jgi:hypothetical protein